ncbi:protocatechuate 3,4-dioxygenase [Tepidicella xavieri]|uniref:Protocatechuate 3,4-dioxygenase beta subunit n=1 Tax=Tepidicella xavieri TaxID=360241 RepID=A0A4R6UAS6_9BURK|nr:protocatechuate 3,4-dioxygenase [Tepidicella xavieri]TDQ43740.1 protocatechuate 3,4-dioxygenase beta subunit [Tepidicella xavieri]
MIQPARRHLLITGAAAAAVALATPLGVRPVRAARPLVPTPSQTEGPFYPVRLPDDHDADLLRNGSLVYRRGQPAWVEGTVVDVDGQPISGAVVEIWQCDEDGRYHHPGDGARADPAFQGFGRMQVGRDGAYRFRTIRPARYSGRTPHIHFKVRRGPHELLTTQLYVEGDPGNERDLLWRRLSPEGRRALTVPFVADGPDVRARFPIVVVA